MRILLFVAVLCGSAGTIGCLHDSPHQEQPRVTTEAQLNANVLAQLPDPNDEAIQQITDATDWHNPYVIVNRSDYELILRDEPRASTGLSLAELEAKLMSLPVDQWPLGRVVAVQENGVRSPGDDELIDNSLQALKRMLETHKVRADLWPTA